MFLMFSCGEVATEKESKVSSDSTTAEQVNKRFFSESSFWNTPIPTDAQSDPKSDHYIKMLETEPTGQNFLINIEKWTIPVYEVHDTTPRYKIGLYKLTDADKVEWRSKRDYYGHGPAFDAEPVPIPSDATPDREYDSHMALVDYKNRVAWDMWGLHKNPDGTWQSKTGMKYSLDGDGTFTKDTFNVVNGESIHFHGPSRAPGVPAIAGLIMYDEVKNGEIKHKLAACTRFAAYKQFTYPAIWTDGFMKDGIPEGATIQLDPNLDLSQFDLLPGEKIVAKAAQKYGIVIVDWGGGQALYGEGLWGHPGKSWNGLLRFEGGISKIPYKHYRVIKMDSVINKGDDRRWGIDPLKVN